MSSSIGNSEYERIRQERDLYVGLLGLSDREHPEPFLDEALGLIVRVLGADQGYLEVFDPNEGPTWWRAAGCSDEQVELIRTIVSRGIIQEALAQGEAIICPSAILDPRFRDRPSVQASQIEAVLCVPIVQSAPIGVLYLQGRRAGGSFSESEVDRARAFARHLGPLVEGLFIRSRQRQGDDVAPFRARLRLDEIVGVSASLAKVLREVELVAPLDVAVLVTGETGTGKTQLARVIHENGRRRGRRFVELNCSAIPENLLESELFGAMPGAHSSATRRIEGKVAAAEGGTLFLDEVAELSLPAQAKLLQFLHTKEYYPLGSSTSHTADVRIIAATNSDLEERVRERRFRSDLVLSVAGPERQDARALGAARGHRAARAPSVRARAAVSWPPRAGPLARRDPSDRGLRVEGQRSGAGARHRGRGDPLGGGGRKGRRGDASLRPGPSRGIREPRPADLPGRDATFSGGPGSARAGSCGLERGGRGANARFDPRSPLQPHQGLRSVASRRGMRPLSRDDLPGVARLFNEGVDAAELTTDVAHRTVDQLASWLLTSPQFEAYVVDEGAGPIAWASLTRHHEREAYGSTAELSVYVTPAERRRGLGLALGEHMVERAKARSFHLLVMLAFGGRPPAIQVAAKLSFTEVGSLRGVYPRDGDWLDVTLLQRRLGPAAEARP